MNQIATMQNQDKYLEYLAAQRHLYDQEKKWFVILGSAVLLVAFLGTGVLTALNVFSPYVMLVTVILLLAEFFFLRVIRSYREQAARIQELFDCDILDLPWNPIITEEKPIPERVIWAVRQFNSKRDAAEWEKLKDWYPPKVAKLPIHQARILCQKENIWWDSMQRRIYARWVLAAGMVIILLLVAVGIYNNWDFNEFFTGPLPLILPLITLAFAHGIHHLEAADRLDRLHTVVHALEEVAFLPDSDSAQLTAQSRQVQDGIFLHRMRSIPVFSWFYDRLRDKFEEDANTAATQIVQSNQTTP